MAGLTVGAIVLRKAGRVQLPLTVLCLACIDSFPADSMEMELWTVGPRCHCPPAISILLATHIFQTEWFTEFQCHKMTEDHRINYIFKSYQVKIIFAIKDGCKLIIFILSLCFFLNSFRSQKNYREMLLMHFYIYGFHQEVAYAQLYFRLHRR